MSHAVLSPSAASRWMACTPSARLEERFPDSESDYAREGTLAHHICELMLKYEHGFITKAKFDKDLAIAKKHELYNEEMLDYCQDFCDYVTDQVVGDASLLIEYKLDMTSHIPEGFGTGDAIVVKDGTMDFNDYKHGKGVRVDAVENKQMMLYALGAYMAFGRIYDVHTIRMTIFQPRVDNISTWQISVVDLLEWADNELRYKAALAFEGKGEFVPGSHCGFCRAKTHCRALHDHNMALAKLDFKDPALLSDEEVLKVHEQSSMFTSWLKSVNEYLLKSALDGKKWPGMKVVEGRSKRSYVDQEKVAKFLESKGYTDIWKEPALLGITDMGKKIGKKTFETIMGPYLVKPSGKPALVPESDPRDPIATAAQDFAQ